MLLQCELRQGSLLPLHTLYLFIHLPTNIFFSSCALFFLSVSVPIYLCRCTCFSSYLISHFQMPDCFYLLRLPLPFTCFIFLFSLCTFHFSFRSSRLLGHHHTDGATKFARQLQQAFVGWPCHRCCAPVCFQTKFAYGALWCQIHFSFAGIE